MLDTWLVQQPGGHSRRVVVPVAFCLSDETVG